MTMQSRTPAVPPARSASASSTQSPPAMAEATRVSSLSPVFARPGASAEIEVTVYEFPQAQVSGEGGRQEQAGIGHQAGVVKGDLDAVGVVAWQHQLGAPFLGSVFYCKTIIPEAQEHLLAAPGRQPDALYRWIRAKSERSL